MKHISLNGVARSLGKKSDVKNLRKNGGVPCNLYGNGIENVNFTLQAADLKLLTHTPNSYLVDLTIEGKSYLAVLHDIQFHPIADQALHADFLAISEDKNVTINVPIEITGNSEGVRVGGKFVPGARKLKVCGLPAALPDVLTVDITSLGLGQQINAGDLKFDGITIVSPKVTMVCAVKHTRAAAAAATEAQ
ncbi:MAG: 50S ribosomal protein L25 [Bacteroidales bacterium]|nr:50S ribosomal protein L25 [Bacteroidales bacterium]